MADNKIVKGNGGTTVTVGSGKKKVVVSGGQKPQVTSSAVEKVFQPRQKVDVEFIVDTTGSMEDKIKALLQIAEDFVVQSASLKLDLQFSLVAFGDISVKGGGDTIELVVPLTDSVEKMRYGLRHIPRNNGFGNTGETCLEAVHFGFKRVQHREGAIKVMILITDEPAIQTTYSAESVTNELTRREYLVFVIATSHSYYKEMANKNGGIWKEIGPNTDLSELLAIFMEMAQKVAQIAKEVERIGDGSVAKYLRLTSGKK